MAPWLDSPAVQRVFWAIAAIAVAIIVSLLAPRVVALLREAREGLTTLRERLGTWANHVLEGRWARFWADRRAEPQEPVLAGLRRIDDAARSLGRDQVRALERLEERLAEHMRLLRAAAVPNAVPAGDDRGRIVRAIAGGGIGTLIGLLMLALALGGLNAALLSVFFREFIGTRPPIPTILPQLQMGHALAVLFFVLEVASGWLIYRYGHRTNEEHEDGASRARPAAETFFLGVAWFLLAALAVVELFAYAVLSDRLNIPQQLRIGPESAFYGIARFFFALFGLALTGALAAVGHAVADAQQRRRRALAEQKLIRALERRDKTVVESVEQVRESVLAIRQAATEMPTGISRSFHEALGLDQPYPSAPGALHAATVRAVSSTEPAAARALLAPGLPPLAAPPLRSPTQVLADLGVHLAIAVVLAVVGTLTTLEVASWVLGRSSKLAVPLAWAAGVGVPAAIIATGVMARNALGRLQYASVVEQTLVQPRGRRVYGLTVIGLAVVAACALAILAVHVGVLGDSSALNILLGIFQAGILVALGGSLDGALVALVHASQLAWMGGVRIVAILGAVAAIVVSGLCAVVMFAIKLLAIPGDLILSFFRTSRAQAPPFSSPQP